MACIWLTPTPSLTLRGCFNCYSNNVTLWKCTPRPLLLTLSRGECRAGAHMQHWMSELPGTEVVSMKENCTANQTVTIRPKWSTSPRVRGRETEKDGARCAEEQTAFYSLSFEVISMKPKSHRSQPAHTPTFTFYCVSISQCSHPNHILIFPILLYIFCLSAWLSHWLSIYSNLLPITALVPQPCQYLSGQLCVCVLTPLSKYPQ